MPRARINYLSVGRVNHDNIGKRSFKSVADRFPTSPAIRAFENAISRAFENAMIGNPCKNCLGIGGVYRNCKNEIAWQSRIRFSPLCTPIHALEDAPTRSCINDTWVRWIYAQSINKSCIAGGPVCASICALVYFGMPRVNGARVRWV